MQKTGKIGQKIRGLRMVVAVSFSILVIAVNCSQRTEEGGGSAEDRERQRLSLRLQWYPQAQFAGFLVAKAKGYYEELGIDLEVRPAGPDLKPHVTVAAGTDNIGIAVPNQIISARANGVPLVVIGQIFQDSPNRYVVLRSSGVRELTDLRRRKVGLWLGGDEAEFIAMLSGVGMSLDDVRVVPQGFSVVPFLEGVYALSQVTNYNELIQIRKVVGERALRVFNPSDYDAAILGDLLFSREDFVEENEALLAGFLRASFKGWRSCREAAEECLEIVLESNRELDPEVQKAQLQTVLEMVFAGGDEIGRMEVEAYERAARILRESGQLSGEARIHEMVANGPWTRAQGKAENPGGS